LGMTLLIGLTGECITELDPEGLIRVQGEIWKGVSECGLIAEGAEVVIKRFQSLTLTVKNKNELE